MNVRWNREDFLFGFSSFHSQEGIVSPALFLMFRMFIISHGRTLITDAGESHSLLCLRWFIGFIRGIIIIIYICRCYRYLDEANAKLNRFRWFILDEYWSLCREWRTIVVFFVRFQLKWPSIVAFVDYTIFTALFHFDSIHSIGID